MAAPPSASFPQTTTTANHHQEQQHQHPPLAAAAQRSLDLEAAARAHAARTPPPPTAVDAARCRAWLPRPPAMVSRAADERARQQRERSESAARAAGWAALVRAATTGVRGRP